LTRFVQRDEAGLIVGHYANLQPGYAEEEIADDHPDFVTWVARHLRWPAEGQAIGEVLYRRAAFEAPGPTFDPGEDVVTREGNVITITRQWVEWDAARKAAYESGRLDTIEATLDKLDDIGRAIVLVVRDEFNRHSAWHRALIGALQSQSTYSGLRQALQATVNKQGLTLIPERTLAMLRTAIRQKLGAAE
jgi:hypothetical protein